MMLTGTHYALETHTEPNKDQAHKFKRKNQKRQRPTSRRAHASYDPRERRGLWPHQLHLQQLKRKGLTWFGDMIILGKVSVNKECEVLRWSQSASRPTLVPKVRSTSGKKAGRSIGQTKIRVILMSVCPIRLRAPRSRVLVYTGQGPIRKTEFKSGSSVEGT